MRREGKRGEIREKDGEETLIIIRRNNRESIKKKKKRERERERERERNNT